MSAGWIVAAIIYALGVVLQWALLDVVVDQDEEWLKFVAFVWPLAVIAHLAYAAWHVTIGHWLWRREHARWCASSSSSRPEEERR